MIRINIPANHVGLMIQEGQVRRVMTAGKYWIWPLEVYHLYNMDEKFLPSEPLTVLQQNEELAAKLNFVDIADHELGIVYKDGNYHEMLKPGRYAYWKGAALFTFVKADLRSCEIAADIDPALLEKGVLTPFVRMYTLSTFEKGILLINGVVIRPLSAGNHYFWKNNDVISVMKADTRQLSTDINGQEVLTRDKAQLRINFTVQYRIVDLQKALLENNECERQLYLQMQLILRELVGKSSFDELMENKDSIAAEAHAKAVESAEKLGITVTSLGLKDIILPGDIKDIMNQVLVAEKRAQANVIMRREETASTRSLLNTAKLMEDNAMLFKLKEMEYVEKIAEKIHTITLSGGSQVVDQLKQLFVK